MSTRSGKRIHNSFSNVESDSEKQIERNTRSKRVKEKSCEVSIGKRKNFVRRPSNDEVESSSDKTENTSKSVRKSKRYTLKELNVPVDDYEVLNVRKSMRQSRRIRKEDTVEPTSVFILETNELEVETRENKKNKKKRALIENWDNRPVKAITITKKKTNKHKKKSNSFTVEEFVAEEHNKSVNKSNVSIDSFHSAAGSPDKIDKNGHRKESISQTLSHSHSVDNLKDTKKKSIKSEIDNQLESSINKASKLCQIDELFESSVNNKEEKRDENVIRFEKEISCTSKPKSKRKRNNKWGSLNDGCNKHGKADLIHSLELHNSIEANINCKDLKKKTVEKINSPTSNFDLINIPHVKGTVNDLHNTSHLNMSSMKGANSTSINSTFDKMDVSMTLLNKCNKDMSDDLIDRSKVQLDGITLNNTTRSENLTGSKSKDDTYEKVNLSETNSDQTFDTINSFDNNCNADKELFHTSKRSSRCKSAIINTTYDKVVDNFVDTDTTFNKKPSKKVNGEANYTVKSIRSSRKSLPQDYITVVSTDLNGTYDKIIKDDSSSFCNNTYDKLKLDTTFEKTKDNIDGDITINLNAKSSIIISDNTDNMTSDMSEDCSRISIASDDSKTEIIINTTPLLIESSMEESQINSASILLNETTTPQKKVDVTKIITRDKQGSSVNNYKTALQRETFTETKATSLKRDGTYTELRKTHSNHRSSLIKEHDPQVRDNPTTPLQREGTFTKESPDVISLKPKSVDITPTRRKSMASPGRTPFPSGTGSRTQVALNVTHSIEKPQRPSSAAAVPPRPTRVMFRSPVDDPVALTEMKGKIIKSNLKGSSKSFMFESASEQCGSRKRSRTQVAAGGGALGGGAKRARTASAAARMQAPVEVVVTSAVSKSNAKPRTKLPNFAALHQKQFLKMESLDECQRRHARRARALLTPTVPLTPTLPLTPTVPLTPSEPLTPIVPLAPGASLTPKASRGMLQRNNPRETSDTAQFQAAKKPVTLKSKEFDKKNQSYTRFGFKLNLDVNPFSVPAKTADVPTLPSLAGTTLRKEAAKQAVMREKSFQEKRDLNRSQNRTVIKGVRTNRRFELQMKMRNID